MKITIETEKDVNSNFTEEEQRLIIANSVIKRFKPYQLEMIQVLFDTDPNETERLKQQISEMKKDEEVTTYGYNMLVSEHDLLCETLGIPIESQGVLIREFCKQFRENQKAREEFASKREQTISELRKERDELYKKISKLKSKTKLTKRSKKHDRQKNFSKRKL